jgi:hypothetical protein
VGNTKGNAFRQDATLPLMQSEYQPCTYSGFFAEELLVEGNLARFYNGHDEPVVTARTDKNAMSSL